MPDPGSRILDPWIQGPGNPDPEITGMGPQMRDPGHGIWDSWNPDPGNPDSPAQAKPIKENSAKSANKLLIGGNGENTASIFEKKLGQCPDFRDLWSPGLPGE